MINIKDHKTQPLFDPWAYLGPKCRQMLDNSWAGLFREEILPNLPVAELSPFFSSSNGRPSKELHTMLGVVILQQAHNLTDEETRHQLAYSAQWHYALNIPEVSDSARYMCAKTLFNIRQILISNNLDGVLFDSTTDALAEAFNVGTSKQRLDSVHVKSNMKRMGRIGIFTQTVSGFLKALKRHYPLDFNELPEEFAEKYIPKNKEKGCFAQVKPSKSQKTLKIVSTDLYELVERFKERDDITSMKSYKLLERVLSEQCIVSPDAENEKVSLKPAKDIPASSLQNPSDPDAAYSGHKGQGYQVQLMETCSDDKKEDELNLITYVEAEPADNSDANALIPAIDSVKERGLGPKEALADAVYGSDENVEAAKKRGVTLTAPTMGQSEKSELTLADFEFSDTQEVSKCPQGHQPEFVKQNKNNNFSAAFNTASCRNCPMKAQCPIQPGKKYYYLRYNKKKVRISQRRAEQQSQAFKERYRLRAGVEATMSEYNARTGVKQLRVRGLENVRYAARLKAIAVNIFRATAVRKARKAGNTPLNHAFSPFLNPFLSVKELFFSLYSFINTLSHNYADDYPFSLKMSV